MSERSNTDEKGVTTPTSSVVKQEDEKEVEILDQAKPDPINRHKLE